VFTNWTVDLFILEDWVILHMPFFQGVAAISAIDCVSEFTCHYAETFYVSTAGLPANRRPFHIVQFELFREGSNCREGGASPDKCLQCGGANTTIFVSTGGGDQFGSTEYYGSDGIFHFYRGLNPMQGFTACYDVYQASFLYQINP
jgi:hypothetical protein